jgi:hypothetical protein
MQMLLRQVVVQPGHVPAQRLAGVCRTGYDGGMNTARAPVRAHANPAKRRVLKSAFGSLGSRMNPCRRTRRIGSVKSGKCVAAGFNRWIQGRSRNLNLRIPDHEIPTSTV